LNENDELYTECTNIGTQISSNEIEINLNYELILNRKKSINAAKSLIQRYEKYKKEYMDKLKS